MSFPALEHSYARLPESFYARIAPTPVAAPGLLRLNEALAERLGLDPAWLASPEGIAMLAGNRLPEDAEPIAMAYAGHQFGNFVPSLGDGRAVLLGERRDAEGIRYDIQLKGAGQTPFSRRGDGRSALGPVLREYLVSEAMAALGIPTTRALAALATGESVYRERPLPGGILVRVARCHVRVGTFEYFAQRGDEEAVRRLADYVIERVHPDAAAAEDPYRALLDGVVERQAALIAQWLGVGFIHGVMNTDNTSISGETIDFGPCAFLDHYDPAKVFSSIDQGGRYAFGRQPGIAVWNLARLAETLLPLFATSPSGDGTSDRDAQVASAQAALDAFEGRFEAHWQGILHRKLGLAERSEAGLALAGELLAAMAEQKADFTLTFRGLLQAVEAGADDDVARRAGFGDPAAFGTWAGRWRARLAEEGRTAEAIRNDLRSTNPAFIPRNHRIEQAIEAAIDGDLAPFERLLAVVTRPYDDDPGRADLADGPEPDEIVRQTFCGT